MTRVTKSDRSRAIGLRCDRSNWIRPGVGHGRNRRLQCQGHLPLTQYQENSHLQGPWPIPVAWCCFKSLQVPVQSSRPGIPFCYDRKPAVLVPAFGRQHWAMLILFFPGIIRIKSQYLSDISGTQSGVGTAMELFWNQNMQSCCHAPNVFGTVDMEKVSWWTNVKNTHKICQDYPYVKNEYNAHHSHLSHKNDFPGARDECQHLAVISHTSTTKKQKNPKNNDHFGMRKERKLLQSNSHTRTTKGEREESFLVPKCQI